MVIASTAKDKNQERIEKEKALEATFKDIEKTLGTTVRRLKDFDKEMAKVEVVPTGSLALDDVLGVGGYPRGRVIEIYGRPSGGKTALTLVGIAQVQKMGGTAAFIDAEHAFDREWAEKLGVDTENLIFEQPDYGEQALTVCEKLVLSSAVDMIVIDSTAALIPKAEMEDDLDKQSIALQARMMSKAMRRLIGMVGKTKAIVIFVNQIRQNPMVMFGNPISTPGGEALKFYSSVRLEVNKMGGTEVKDEFKNILGHRMKIKAVKNKVGPPLKVAELTFLFASGVDRVGETADLSVARKIVELKGNTYHYGEQKWVGINKLREALQADENLRVEIEKRVLEPVVSVPVVETETEKKNLGDEPDDGE